MTAAFERLTAQIRGRSSTEYPWLDEQYSPGSRIPCCDVTPYLRDLLAAGDRDTIKSIMRAIIAANPGLFISVGSGSGDGTFWMAPIVDEVADLPVEQFVRFRHDPMALNVRAFLILVGKDGGGPAFTLLPRPEIMAAALLSDEPEWQPGMETLRERANRFLMEMKKDTPFWDPFPLFTPISRSETVRPQEDFMRRLRGIPLGARVQLVYMALRAKPLTVSSATDYFIRSLGFDAHDGIRALVGAGLIAAVDRPDAALADVTRDQLLATAAASGVTSLKKSAKKADIVRVLVSQARSAVASLMQQHLVYEIHPNFAGDVTTWLAVVRAEQQAVSLLCFLRRN